MSNNNNGNNPPPNPWTVGAWGLAIGAAVGTAVYMLSGSSKKAEKTQESTPRRALDSTSASRSTSILSHKPSPALCERQPEPSEASNDNTSSYLADMVSRVLLNSSSPCPSVESSSAPDNPVITNLNSLLHDIHVRYLKLKEFPLHYKVFDVIFQDLHKKMKDVNPYYGKYSSTVQFAGSHFDKLRIKKPDEFDMDVVISLPINLKVDPYDPKKSDVVLEAKAPGFVQLKMGMQFQNLHMRDGSGWETNKDAYKWMDKSYYLLRSEFIEWFEGVVNRALNQYKVKVQSRPVVYVEGIPYIIGISKSGPAMTLKIRNNERNFSMDIDLVPCLKFPEERWPISKAYRAIPEQCKKGYWMVVPKPNKESVITHDQNRGWRIALQNQEKQLMYNSNNLKLTIQLMKKLRDSLEMKKIASYYIKTIFFWEIVEINNEQHWRKSLAVLFKQMVGKLHAALVAGNIPYFWNKSNNLIAGVDKSITTQYAKKLVPLMEILEDPSKYKLVAKYLLTREEFADYNEKFLHI